MKELNLYFKNLNIVILTLFSLNSISQNTNIKFHTGDLSLEKQKEQIVLRKSFYIDIFNSLTPEIQIEKGTYKLNYKIDENGKITFIKGHIGFLKIEIPYEFIGIHFPYYDDEKFIDKINNLVTDCKITHYLSSEKQPDCKKLKNIIFYGDFRIGTYYKKS